MIDRAWKAFVDQDQRLNPPPDLEQRVIAAIRDARSAERQPSSRLRPAIGMAAAIVIAIGGWLARPQSVPTPLVARSFDAAPLPGPVSPRPPMMRIEARTRPVAVSPGLYVEHVEWPAALMMLGAAPVTDSEPLRLVRLRLPREALQALGLVMLEPEAEGVVEVNVLVGEDGLPRDIRGVRAQEQR